MPIIRQIYTNQRISQPIYKEKILIKSQDVNLKRLFSKSVGENFEVHFAVLIIPRGNYDSAVPITPATINLMSLKDAIASNIRSQDKKYMVVDNFDTRKVIFKFNHEKWLKDATSSMRPSTEISRFRRDFKLKAPLPPMLLTDFVSKPIEDFILKKFIKWLESSRKEEQFFKYLIPENFRSKVRAGVRSMFEWEYNKQWNIITAVLKPMYVFALLYATGQIINNFKEAKKSDLMGKERDFASKVKRNISSFDKNKWEKYIKRKFM